MTTPGGTPPDQAWVRGGGEWRYGQDLTEASSKSIMAGGVQGSYGGARTQFSTSVETPIANTAASVASNAAVVVTTSVINGQTVTRSIYNANGTWTKPTPAAGLRISRIAAAVINGGNGGNGPPASNGEGGEGGEGGGYSYREWADHTAVGSSETITVGAGGTGGGTGALGQVGGTSSFGSLLSGKSGTSSVLTTQGAVAATCAPGRGGNGGGGGEGDSYSYESPGQRGQSTALGTGGNGGTAAASGSAAGATASDSQIVSGGAGGGGGGGCDDGGSIGSTRKPGGGGAGASPGGGGGGAGGGRKGLSASYLPGGAGANGSVTVWTYFEDDPDA